MVSEVIWALSTSMDGEKNGLGMLNPRDRFVEMLAIFTSWG